MANAHIKLVTLDATQTIRLPSDLAFPEGVEELEIKIVGEGRLIVPRGRVFAHWLEYGRRAIDFPDRDQPAMQERHLRF